MENKDTLHSVHSWTRLSRVLTYEAYWRHHPYESWRLEMTVFFGKNYDAAVYQEDWRRLLALARWARFWKMPILEDKARRTARKYMPEREKQMMSNASKPEEVKDV